jgi:hypothetical protein
MTYQRGTDPTPFREWWKNRHRPSQHPRIADDQTRISGRGLLTGLLGMAPGVGEAMDAWDVGAGLLQRDAGRVATGLLGAAVPFATGASLRRMAGKADDLPMDDASRMARARDMGFSPQVAYHGTPDARGIMEDGFSTPLERYRRSTGEADFVDENAAYFFADDRGTAASYADDTRAFDYQNAEPAVLPVHLRMSNPMEIDWGGKPWRGTREAIAKAREAGHDGIVIRNVRDHYSGQGGPTTVRVVFDPSQIRSTEAIFDPRNAKSADILAGMTGLGLFGAARGRERNR